MQGNTLEESAIVPNTRYIGGAFETIHSGGLSFHVKEEESLQQIVMNCHLFLGTASHVYLRCGDIFYARNMEELRRKVSSMPFWSMCIDTAAANNDDSIEPSIPKFNIKVKSTKSKLIHTVGIAQRIERGIYDALGIAIDDGNDEDDEEGKERTTRRNSYNENAINILVHIHRDQVQISMDTSATPLHKRGYKLEVAKAPLREDLAFALLRCAGWGTNPAMTSSNFHGDRKTNSYYNSNFLLDPFCGSGTILIEGAAMAVGLPPGRLRPPPLWGTTLFDDDGWRKLVEKYNVHIGASGDDTKVHNLATASSSDEIDNSNMNMDSNEKDDDNIVATTNINIFGSDRDAGAIKAAKANAERAGVSNVVTFECYPLSSNPWFEQPNSAPFFPSMNDDTDCDERTGDYYDIGLLVATNPPYGKRVSALARQRTLGSKKSKLSPGAHPLLSLYQTFGHRIGRIVDTIRNQEKSVERESNIEKVGESSGVNGRTSSTAIRAAIIANDIDLVRKTGLRTRVQFKTRHGGLAVSALTTEDNITN